MNTSLLTPISPILAHYTAPVPRLYPGTNYAPSGDLAEDRRQENLRRMDQAANNAMGVLFVWSAITIASVGFSAYHGAKRNRGELLPALGWGLLGGMFPVIVPVIALAQGYAKPA